jgi:DNA polymerase-3 subunit gamma/tau
MSYLVLARKWRPKTFSEIVGQEHVIRALTNALQSGRLHHAYLFAGTRGVGKTTIARILAKALNCQAGMTDDPCGECSACREIDEGRFVDLIEVDAASKTKVDDTRELLDNVQFAPAAGRYKVYLIDEVHMLTKHSFNALLKTLEEPPPHVKFLLATTDPQKLPVTVLSRCLQFNLKRLTPRLIRDRLEYICGEEAVEAESAALGMIARAADGSLRDALSLLDQAIAYCGGEVGEAPTAEMLGTIDRRHVNNILALLSARDAAGLMAAIAEIDQQFPNYEQLLDDLARTLQRIAVLQVVGRESGDEDLSVEDLAGFAESLSAEDLQLFYQIAITGRRDLPLAPDPRSGVEMTLLRMLAFQPGRAGRQTVTQEAVPSSEAPARPSRKAAARAPASARDAAGNDDPVNTGAPAGVHWDDPDWAVLIAGLDLKGAVMLLASNCTLLGREGNEVRLGLDPSAESYLTRARLDALQAALSRHFGEQLRVQIVPGETGGETPLQRQSRLEDEGLQAAKATLESDPNVRALKDVFGATLRPDTVRIIDKQ